MFIVALRRHFGINGDYNYTLLRLANILTGIVLASHGLAMSVSSSGIVVVFNKHLSEQGDIARFVVSSLLFFFGGLCIWKPVHDRWQGVIASIAFLPLVIAGLIYSTDFDAWIASISLFSLFFYMLISQLMIPEH